MDGGEIGDVADGQRRARVSSSFVPTSHIHFQPLRLRIRRTLGCAQYTISSERPMRRQSAPRILLDCERRSNARAATRGRLRCA